MCCSFLLVPCVCVQELAEVTAADLLHSLQGALPTCATPTSSVPLAGRVIYLVVKPFTITESHDHVG